MSRGRDIFGKGVGSNSQANHWHEKIFEKLFKNPLDKSTKVWYNKYRNKG